LSIERNLSTSEAEPFERPAYSLHWHRSLAEHSPLPLATAEGAAHIVRYVNPAFCRLTETSGEDLIGKPFLFAVPQSAENGSLAVLDSVYHTGTAESLADRQYRHVTSELSYWSYTIWAILDANDRPEGVVIQITDTTQQTLARQRLNLFSQTLLLSGLHQQETALADETGLQRTAHKTDHRAKNNLQIIVALLDMQIMENVDAISVGVLQQLRLHIQTVASFHDLLAHFGTDAPAAGTLSAMAILYKLLPMWQKIIGIQEFRWSAEPIVLPVKQGMSLALLINELLTNAVKHGGNRVELQLALRENFVTLTISNDGAGFSSEFDPATSAHFGLEFVENVIRLELKGEVTYANNSDGACVTITFPLAVPAPRDLDSIALSTVFEPSLLLATMRSFAALAKTMQDHAIILLDEWSNIVKWSLGAENLFGYSASEVLGMPLSMLYTVEDVSAAHVTRELQQTRQKGLTSEDRWMQRKDGSRFFASSILTALTDTDVRGFIKILRDTAEQKEIPQYQN